MIQLLLMNVSSLRLNARKKHYLKSIYPYQKFVTIRKMCALMICTIATVSTIAYFMLRNVFKTIALGFVVIPIICVSILSVWVVCEWIFSKHSPFKIYRVRRLLQRITVELSNMNKQVHDMPFHAVTFEFWIEESYVHIQCYTSGFLRTNTSIEQLPQIIQNYLIAENINRKDHWSLIDTSIYEGFIEMKFGDIPSRAIYKERYFNEN